jgi:hypothetical protein
MFVEIREPRDPRSVQNEAEVWHPADLIHVLGARDSKRAYPGLRGAQ